MRLYEGSIKEFCMMSPEFRGDKEFVRRLVKMGEHYLPRRQGRRASKI